MFRNRRFNLNFRNSAVLGLILALTNCAVADALAPKKTGAGNEPVVTMETSKGPIKISLNRKETPITVANFIDLAQKGFYNGIKFHRYVPGFIIQGGDPQGSGTGVYVDPATHQERKIPLEMKSSLTHNLGSVSMARTSDPNSASCQFYICLAAQAKLDSQDPVFGTVIDGLPTLNALREGDKIVRMTVQEPGAK